MSLVNPGTLRHRVLQQLSKNPRGLTCKEVALLCGCTEGSASGTLNALCKMSLVKRVEDSPVAKYTSTMLALRDRELKSSVEVVENLESEIKELDRQIEKLDSERQKKITALEVISEYLRSA